MHELGQKSPTQLQLKISSLLSSGVDFQLWKTLFHSSEDYVVYEEHPKVELIHTKLIKQAIESKSL